MKLGMIVHVCTNSKLSSACLWQLVSREVLTAGKVKPYVTDPLLTTFFLVFLELRKCQKLLEPPPSAKPITLDVDRKLEDGQKVTIFYRERNTHRVRWLQFRECLELLFPGF